MTGVYVFKYIRTTYITYIFLSFDNILISQKYVERIIHLLGSFLIDHIDSIYLQTIVRRNWQMVPSFRINYIITMTICLILVVRCLHCLTIGNFQKRERTNWIYTKKEKKVNQRWKYAVCHSAFIIATNSWWYWKKRNALIVQVNKKKKKYFPLLRVQRL